MQKSYSLPKMFSRISDTPGFSFEKAQKMRATVCGVGGLGMIVGIMLGKFGIGKVYAIDCDTVEGVNANRLFFSEDDEGKRKVELYRERMDREAPYTEVVAIYDNIMNFSASDEPFSETDIIFVCTDSEDSRFYINSIGVEAGVPMIFGGISNDGFKGRVQVVIPGETACYACMHVAKMKLDDKLRIRAVYSNSLAPALTLTASIMATEGLKLLFGSGIVCRDLILFDLQTADNMFYQTKVVRNPTCPHCGNQL